MVIKPNNAPKVIIFCPKKGTNPARASVDVAFPLTPTTAKEKNRYKIIQAIEETIMTFLKDFLSSGVLRISAISGIAANPVRENIIMP